MKAFFAIILFICFSIFVGMNHLNNKNSLRTQITHCPSNHKEAEADLKGYLSKERTVEDLREKYGLSIDHTSHNKIYSLQSELDQDKCKKLIENSPWLESVPNYSFYKVDGNYFIVTYSQTEKGNFERQGISIFNEQFKRVAIVIDIGTSQ